MSEKTVKTQKEKAIFEKTCPNCGGPISDIRLQKGLPCSKCLPQQVENEDKACEVLLKENKLNKDFKEICTLKEELEKFRNFFFEIHRSYPWSLQEAWFKRFFLGRSFALLAPTGIGKTTFGLTLSYYLAKKKNKKSYLIFPTRLLVEQAINKLRKMGVPEEYLLYFGEKPSLTKKQKEERFRRLEEGDFRILITTSMFLYRNIDKIPKGVYELIFVDDVDSFLKTAKNIDKALYLLGFTEKEIEWALKIIKLRKELAQKPNVSPEEWEKLKKEEEKLKKHAEKVRKGVLIVSSATSNPRSERIKLFRELLGFEVGRPLFYLRNVVDSYEDKFLQGKKSLTDHKPLWDFVADFVKQHPKGGLIYISQDRGKEEVDRLVEYLNSKGLNVRSYEELDKHLKDYEEGKVNAFVGIASYRNPLARGFDMPHVVRYALFVGVPKLKFTLKVEEHISHILWALVAIRPLIAKDKELREKYLQKLDRWIERLRKYSYLSEEFIQQNERLKEIIENIRNEVREFIENPEILERIKESDEITLRWDEKEGYSLIVADVTGYLQASGRTSRLYAGGLTKGFSLVLVDDTKAFNNLRKKVKWFSEEIEFIPLKEVDLKTLFEEIEKDRQKVLRFLKGEIPEEVKELIKPVLVIVESPNKARTIANFFGKPLRRRVGDIDVLEVSLGDKFLTITASAGHVYDLIKEKKNYRNTFHGVIVEPSKENPEHFIPIYEPIKQETPEGEIRNKEEIINSLRQAGLEVAEVYIGTDPDSITGDSKVLVKVDGKTKHLTVEELFELLKEEYKVELRNGHEYIKPTNLWVPVVDKNYRVRFGKAKYLIRHKVKKPIYKITTQSGREIKITGDHSIFRLDENLNLEEVKPTELREGDFIVVNETLPSEGKKITFDLAEYKEALPIAEVKDKTVILKRTKKEISRFVELDEDLATFLGLWVGDGSYHQDRYVRISCRDREVLELIDKLGERFKFNYSLDGDGITVVIHSKFLAEFMKKVLKVEGKAHTKRVPEIIFNASREIISSFLKGLFSADGTVSKGEANLTTVSENLKEDVVSLFLMLGINPKVYKEGNFFRIFLHGEDTVKFSQRVGFLQKHKREKLNKTFSGKSYTKLIAFNTLRGKVQFKKGINSYAEAIYRKGYMSKNRLKEFVAMDFVKPFFKAKLQKVLNGDIYTERIKKIEKLPLEEQYVYDFETETQNFIANNILCHNTEGEKIAWDLYEVIKPYNSNIRRMEFHEVTKRAIVEAIHNPRQIDINLVEAQMVRRIADRWVGFELSRLLQEHFKKPWLSAGRVQTPVLGWVIERDKLYRTKKGAVFVYLPNPQKDKRRISVSWEFEDKKLAREFYKNLTEVEVKILQNREEEKKPAPPFTTDVMLKEASDKLRFSASKTMQLAQELFEAGLSTYHRTDSTRVSDVGISIAREYIDENFGQDYFYPRHWGEGGAHECIRPTHPWDVEELRSMMLAGQLKGLTKDHLRLYELIFKRFMASQMRPATVEVSKFEVKPLLEKKDLPTQSVEKEEITSLLRDGFNLMTPIEVYYLKEGTFKVVEQKDLTDEEGNKIGEHSESAMKIYKLVPLAYPYTQGSLIEEMKKRGIGRPSTYAQIVQKLLDRGYVIERKNFLFPTKLGKEVYNYLIRLKEAEKFVKEEFTRILEELMDRIERGEVYYIEVLKDLYEEVLRLEKLKTT
ncbi:MAG: reverse gyrase [Aquificae bacterium]|nr:reverse gyrase [Aquificota bacterium]